MPCPQAFSIVEKDTWILTKDQVMEILAELHSEEEEDEGQQDDEE